MLIHLTLANVAMCAQIAFGSPASSSMVCSSDTGNQIVQGVPTAAIYCDAPAVGAFQRFLLEPAPAPIKPIDSGRCRFSTQFGWDTDLLHSHNISTLLQRFDPRFPMTILLAQTSGAKPSTADFNQPQSVNMPWCGLLVSCHSSSGLCADQTKDSRYQLLKSALAPLDHLQLSDAEPDALVDATLTLQDDLTVLLRGSPETENHSVPQLWVFARQEATALTATSSPRQPETTPKRPLPIAVPIAADVNQPAAPLEPIADDNPVEEAVESVELRYIWSGRQAQSEAARHLVARQTDCSKPQVMTEMTSSGMGSDLHCWSKMLHNAHLAGASLVVQGKWKWEDERLCANTLEPKVTLSCYFDNTRPCPLNSLPLEMPVRQPLFSPPEEFNQSISIEEVERLNQPRRTAAMEMLFSNVSDAIINRTQRAAAHVFGPRGSPDRMITVHIRWSDKGRESELQDMQGYIKGCQTLIEKHNIPSPVSIFVMSEDVSALAAFKEIAMHDWQIFHYDYDDPAAIETHQAGELDAMDSSTTLEQKEELFYTFGKDKTNIQGAWSLIALLLSLESQYFVLTTASNWSRLVNELREAITDVDCGGCTDVVDLLHDWHSNY